MKQKIINAYIEKYKGKVEKYPNVWFEKPSKRELDNHHEFGYKVYKCQIIIGKEIK